MLQSELARRGVDENPLWFEERLDPLETTRAERAQQGVQALKTLGKFGLFVAKAIREHELPDLPDMSVPDWLEPPAPAVYAVPQRRDPGRQWTAVRLQEGIEEWLPLVHAALPRLIKMVESATLEAWLVREQGDDHLSVHLGDRRVGSLDEESTVAYRDAIDAAAKRAELVCVEARLTPIAAEQRYLLEVALPVAGGARSERTGRSRAHPRRRVPARNPSELPQPQALTSLSQALARSSGLRTPQTLSTRRAARPSAPQEASLPLSVAALRFAAHSCT